MIRTVDLTKLDTEVVNWVAEVLQMSLIDPNYLHSYGMARPQLEAHLRKMWHHLANEEEEGTVAWGTGIMAFCPAQWSIVCLLLKQYCDATSEGHKYLVEWLLGVWQYPEFVTEAEYWANSPDAQRLCEGRVAEYQCDLGYGHTGKHGAVVNPDTPNEQMIWWDSRSERVY